MVAGTIGEGGRRGRSGMEGGRRKRQGGSLRACCCSRPRTRTLVQNGSSVGVKGQVELAVFALILREGRSLFAVVFDRRELDDLVDGKTVRLVPVADLRWAELTVDERSIGVTDWPTRRMNVFETLQVRQGR